MCDPLTIASVALPAVSGIMKGNSEADAKRQAYGAAGNFAQSGEQGLMDAINTPSQYLGKVNEDINQQGVEGMQDAQNELNLSLAQKGVRGSAATNLLGRQFANMQVENQRDLNKLNLSDEQRKNAALLAYQSQKGLTGMQSQLGMLR